MDGLFATTIGRIPRFPPVAGSYSVTTEFTLPYTGSQICGDSFHPSPPLCIAFILVLIVNLPHMSTTLPQNTTLGTSFDCETPLWASAQREERRSSVFKLKNKYILILFCQFYTDVKQRWNKHWARLFNTLCSGWGGRVWTPIGSTFCNSWPPICSTFCLKPP